MSEQTKRREELEIKVHKRRKAMTAAGTDLSEESYLPMDYYSDSEVGKIEDQNLAITKEINRLLKKWKIKKKYLILMNVR